MVKILSGDFQRGHEVELPEWVEDFGVVVPKRHRADVAREIHEDVTVHVGTERADGGGGVVSDELVDVRTRGAKAVVVVDEAFGPLAREPRHLWLRAVTVHTCVTVT